jgi:hypothetical protein
MKIRNLVVFLFVLTSLIQLGYTSPARADSEQELSPNDNAKEVGTTSEDLAPSAITLKSAPSQTKGSKQSKTSNSIAQDIHAQIVSPTQTLDIQQNTAAALLAVPDVPTQIGQAEFSNQQANASLHPPISQPDAADASSAMIKRIKAAVLAAHTDPTLLAQAELSTKPATENVQQLISQANTSPPTFTDDELRQQLKIPSLLVPKKQTYPPGLTFGTPSAFGANWGDLFIGASGATAGKARDGKVNGSISMGAGLGDSQRSLGLELTYNIGSIRKFGQNGTFDLKAHRIVYARGSTQVAAAVGWNSFAQYVTGERVTNSSVYGAVSAYSVLKPNDPVNTMPVALTIGAGGGQFSQTNATRVFGGLGVQVHPQVGVGMGWSGVGLNAGVSVVPVPTIPFTITAQGGDLTDQSLGGTVFVLSIGYGFNFLPR